jgi:hypothetical protein
LARVVARSWLGCGGRSLVGSALAKEPGGRGRLVVYRLVLLAFVVVVAALAGFAASPVSAAPIVCHNRVTEEADGVAQNFLVGLDAVTYYEHRIPGVGPLFSRFPLFVAGQLGPTITHTVTRGACVLAAAPGPAEKVFRCDNVLEPNPSVYDADSDASRGYTRPVAIKDPTWPTQIGNGYGLTCGRGKLTGKYVDSIGEEIPAVYANDPGTYPVAA